MIVIGSDLEVVSVEAAPKPFAACERHHVHAAISAMLRPGLDGAHRESLRRVLVDSFALVDDDFNYELEIRRRL